MRAVRWIFAVAFVWGIAVVAPLYFLEGWVGANYPPPPNRPELYYGFVGIVLASQFLYALIASDPVRFRPIMLVGMGGKLSFVVACVTLYAGGRVAMPVVAMSMTDLLLVLLFGYGWWRTGQRPGA